MLKKLIIAIVLIAFMPVSGAFAEDQPKVTKSKKRFEDVGKDLEAQDKLGNFEIQDLMSTFNEPSPPPKKQ